MPVAMVMEPRGFVTPPAEELTLRFPELAGFSELGDAELMGIDGGINWDRIFAGGTVYLGATMALISMTGPIGLGVGATYLLICAASGAYIGYGITT